MLTNQSTSNLLIVDFPQPQQEECNLIVDFPQEFECSAADEYAMRRVQFSTASELCVYDACQATADRNKIWYFDNEYHTMRSEFKRTVQTLHQQYRRSLSHMNSMSVHNMNRVRAVLDEQERQDRVGIKDPDKLACISQRYSQWSRIRSKIHLERFL